MGELANEIKFFKHWQANPKISLDKIMYEYADVLHFYLSISLLLKVDFDFYEDYYNSLCLDFSKDNYYLDLEIEDKLCIMFSYVFYEISLFSLKLNYYLERKSESDKVMFKILFYLNEIAILNGCSYDEIYKYYLKKKI